jgi:hypothetical protein
VVTPATVAFPLGRHPGVISPERLKMMLWQKHGLCKREKLDSFCVFSIISFIGQEEELREEAE